MTDPQPSTLSELHELPWSEIAGAHVVVRQVVDNVDHALPRSERSDPDERQPDHERREGDLVGRAIGDGLYYDTKRGENVADQIGPAVYLHAPDNTVLEVSTKRKGTELLSFELDSEVDDAD